MCIATFPVINSVRNTAIWINSNDDEEKRSIHSHQKKMSKFVRTIIDTVLRRNINWHFHLLFYKLRCSVVGSTSPDPSDGTPIARTQAVLSVIYISPYEKIHSYRTKFNKNYIEKQMPTICKQFAPFIKVRDS